MKIGIATPFPGSDVETGSVCLLGSYLRTLGNVTVLYQNDFAFPSEGTLIPMQKAALLMREQEKLSEWCGSIKSQASSFLRPLEYEAVSTLVELTPAEQLFSFGIPGFEAYQLLRGGIKERVGSETPNLSPVNVKIVRDTLKEGINAYLAAGHFAAETKPELMLLGGGDHFITTAMSQAFLQAGVKTLVFSWKLENRCIRIFEKPGSVVHDWFYLLDDLDKLRNDVRNWPAELLRLVREVLETFGIGADLPVRAAV